MVLRGTQFLREWSDGAPPMELNNNMDDKSSGTLSRRSFMVLVAAGGSAIGAAGAWHRWESIATLGHGDGPVKDAEVDSTAIATVAEFAGVMFGVNLTEVDRTDLTRRIEFAVTHDSGWADEYAWLSAFVDEAATEFDAPSYVEADADAQDAIMRMTVDRETHSRTRRINAFFRIDGRVLMRMRRSTIPHLTHVYRNSGVPWRQRGYTSWPGLPNDMLAYTGPAGPGSC